MSLKLKLKRMVRRRYIDPSVGLEVNTLHTDYRVGRRVYEVDIARTPQVARGSIQGGMVICNIHRMARKVNDDVNKANFMTSKFKGRR